MLSTLITVRRFAMVHPRSEMVQTPILLVERHVFPSSNCQLPMVPPIPTSLALQAHQIVPTGLQRLRTFLITIPSLSDGHPSRFLIRHVFPNCKLPMVSPVSTSLALQTHQVVPTGLQRLRILLITSPSLSVGHLSRLTPLSVVLPHILITR